MRKGVQIYECFWNVVRLHWNGSEYVEGNRWVVPGIPHAPEPTIINCEFEIGKIIYGIVKDVYKNGVKIETVLDPITEGFYSSESIENTEITGGGSQIQSDWAWGEKPYGLKEPTITIEVEVNQD